MFFLADTGSILGIRRQKVAFGNLDFIVGVVWFLPCALIKLLKTDRHTRTQAYMNTQRHIWAHTDVDTYGHARTHTHIPHKNKVNSVPAGSPQMGECFLISEWNFQ